uniref:CFAP91 domain-containing protein n=1 Tax=Strongyloides stercoralis TaxID=6248 RepID=A0A0K0ERH0_STRER
MLSEPLIKYNNKSDMKLLRSSILPTNEVNIYVEPYYKSKLLYGQNTTYTSSIISINECQKNYFTTNLDKKKSYKTINDSYFIDKDKFNNLQLIDSNRWNEINQKKKGRKQIMIHNTYIKIEKPLNLMNDPRVFRGSVIAKQREYQKLRREIEERKQEEIKYKTNILKSKLEKSFREQNNYLKNLNGIDNYKKDDYQSNYVNLNSSKNLPKVNGPLGVTRRFFDIDEKISKEKNHLNFDNINKREYRKGKKFETISNNKSKLLPLRDEIKHRSLSAEYGRIHKLRKENYSYNKHKPSFSNVKFVPIEQNLEYDKNSSNNIPTKVVPTISNNRRIADNKLSSYGRKKVFVNNDNVPNNSLSTPISYVDGEVQTQEDPEEFILSLARELSTNAILTSLTNLKSEEEIEKLKKDKISITNNLIKKHTEIIDLEKIIYEKNNKEENLLRQRDEMMELIKILESRKMAYFTVNEAIENAITNLLDQDMIKETPKFRSIANDTSELEKNQKKYKMAFKEIEFDFMPWILKRAEKVAFQQKAEKELRKAMFSEYDVVRKEAKMALREFIKDVEKLHYKPYKFK